MIAGVRLYDEGVLPRRRSLVQHDVALVVTTQDRSPVRQGYDIAVSGSTAHNEDASSTERRLLLSLSELTSKDSLKDRLTQCRHAPIVTNLRTSRHLDCAFDWASSAGERVVLRAKGTNRPAVDATSAKPVVLRQRKAWDRAGLREMP